MWIYLKCAAWEGMINREKAEQEIAGWKGGFGGCGLDEKINVAGVRNAEGNPSLAQPGAQWFAVCLEKLCQVDTYVFFLLIILFCLQQAFNAAVQKPRSSFVSQSSASGVIFEKHRVWSDVDAILFPPIPAKHPG